MTDDDNENEIFSENATPEPPESNRLPSVAINRSNTPNPRQQAPHINVSPPRTKSQAHSRSHSHTSIAAQTHTGNTSKVVPAVSVSMPQIIPGTTQMQSSLSDSAGMAAATLASFPGHAYYSFAPRPQPQQSQSVQSQNAQLAQQQAYNFQLGFQFQNGQQFVEARPNTVPPQMPQFEYQVSAPPRPGDNMRLQYRSKSSTSVPENASVPTVIAKQEQSPQQPSEQPNLTMEPRLSSSPRAQSVDVGSVARNSSGNTGTSSTAYQLSSVSPPNYMDGSSGAPPSAASGSTMRPKLKLRIPPDETTPAPNSNVQKAHNAGAPSTDASTAVSSSPPSQDNNSAPPLSAVKDVSSPVVLLPPPSPSAYLNSNSLGGPGNPFARPTSLSSAGASAPSHSFPPTTGAANANVSSATSMPNARDQTPISALPSRYVSDLLPSPSTLYTPADWGLQFSAKNGMLAQDLLPSPLQFHTPVVSSAAQSFNRDRSGLGERDTDASGPKRRGWSDEDDGEGPEEKRLKT
ncbi:hypothetical protein V1506DRAFT_542520 [Lipomyces tetrasporus]